MQIGIIGLGRMGMNMALRLKKGGHEIIGYNRTFDKTKAAEEQGIKGTYTVSELIAGLKRPRLVWLMVPAGEPTEETVMAVAGGLSEGDIIVDGANSYFKDSIRRHNELEKFKIEFMDAGVSGGIWGLEKGYCIMAGGKRSVFSHLEPIMKTLAPPGGYMYCGPAGAGHFIKMVHNAIEYGMMEAYAEGMELIKASQYSDGLDYAALSRLWNQGSVIRSWLLELLEDAFANNEVETIKGYVEDSGEGRWAVKESVDLGVEMPAISASLFRRFRSRQEESFGEKVLAALRKEFGGHSVKK